MYVLFYSLKSSLIPQSLYCLILTASLAALKSSKIKQPGLSAGDSFSNSMWSMKAYPKFGTYILVTAHLKW